MDQRRVFRILTQCEMFELQARLSHWQGMLEPSTATKKRLHQDLAKSASRKMPLQTSHLGFSDPKKRHRITHDSDKEGAFVVHKENQTIKFECSPEGLCQHEASEDCKKDA